MISHGDRGNDSFIYASIHTGCYTKGLSLAKASILGQPPSAEEFNNLIKFNKNLIKI